MIALDSALGTPTMAVTKPGLKNTDFHPVTGFVRTRGCLVTTGSRRTARPRALDPSAWICAECKVSRPSRYFCMPGDMRS